MVVFDDNRYLSREVSENVSRLPCSYRTTHKNDKNTRLVRTWAVSSTRTYVPEIALCMWVRLTILLLQEYQNNETTLQF